MQKAETPLVSVLVPVYNAGGYLAECLDSLCAQTYGHLEVIAVNDGSTDASLGILREYAARDERIRIIDKPNTGYGDSMNRALAQAHGTYVGIVEPDDYIDAAMYESYVRVLEATDADLVKSNYYEHADGRDERLSIFDGLDVAYGEPFDPAQHPLVLTVRPSIWAGLYRRSMLADAHIDFAPTPGAAFQDTSFFHMCWVAARSAVILDEAHLHYRVDNGASSSNSSGKVFAPCDEHDRSLVWLRGRGERELRVFGPVLGAARFSCYVWNYGRVAPEFRVPLAQRWAHDLDALLDEGLIDFGLLLPESIDQACLLLADPQAFVARHPDGVAWPGFTFTAGIGGLSFDDAGLIPCIVQDARTGEVLMMAWMNAESVRRTLAERTTWFWSRSRQEFWHKGETSGNTQQLVELRYDCDGDALLARVIPAGPACHTGNTTCFYRTLRE